jgi:DMSO reductase anchor subunit
MLVLTQLSAGAFAIGSVADGLVAPQAVATLRPIHSLVALVVGLVALAASVFHLGRPRYAFRALIGLRTSWMSREILAFGVFAPLAAAYAASQWQAVLLPLAGIAPLTASFARRLQDGLCAAVVAAGVAGVTCSVFIYHATRRPWWNAPTAGFKFAMTALTLGLATTIFTFLGESAFLRDAGVTAAVVAIVPQLASALVGAAALKLVWELAFFRHTRDKQHTECKRTALLMKGDLVRYTVARFVAGAVGGCILPLVVRANPAAASAPALAGLMLLWLLAGELLERTLFFAAVSSARMPGTLA